MACDRGLGEKKTIVSSIQYWDVFASFYPDSICRLCPLTPTQIACMLELVINICTYVILKGGLMDRSSSQKSGLTRLVDGLTAWRHMLILARIFEQKWDDRTPLESTYEMLPRHPSLAASQGAPSRGRKIA